MLVASGMTKWFKTDGFRFPFVFLNYVSSIYSSLSFFGFLCQVMDLIIFMFLPFNSVIVCKQICHAKGHVTVGILFTTSDRSYDLLVKLIPHSMSDSSKSRFVLHEFNTAGALIFTRVLSWYGVSVRPNTRLLSCGLNIISRWTIHIFLLELELLKTGTLPSLLCGFK